MEKIKDFILKHKILAVAVLSIRNLFLDLRLNSYTKKVIKKAKGCLSERVFYLGVPAHRNLGDLAQGVCIRRWLSKNYPQKKVFEIETNAIVNTRFSVLNKLKQIFKSDDIIIFQSGYTTTDLGGFADEMHRAVMKKIPNAKMLMFPQTIFFVDPKNEKRTSECYNQMKNMLFLARDRVSYEKALEIFPDIPVKLYPDIVTTLIGNYNFNYERKGTMMCCRDDGEKFYSDDELAILEEKCRSLEKVDRSDTTKSGNTSTIVRNAKSFVEQEIDTYAHYKLMITDRYHGTILSLVAGTPVIVIKTTDHKVTTGAEWFNGVYDDYVYLAESLEHAYKIAKEVLSKELDYKLEPYFERKYYDKLQQLFKETILR